MVPWQHNYFLAEGVQKYTLLHLLPVLRQGGNLLLNGKPPSEHGFPAWRASIAYVSQSRVNARGTPSDLYFQAQKFAAQKGRPRGDLPALVHELGLDQCVLNQPWSELSVSAPRKQLPA